MFPKLGPIIRTTIVKIAGQELVCLKRRGGVRFTMNWLYSFDNGRTWGPSYLDALDKAQLIVKRQPLVGTKIA